MSAKHRREMGRAIFRIELREMFGRVGVMFPFALLATAFFVGLSLRDMPEWPGRCFGYRHEWQYGNRVVPALIPICNHRIPVSDETKW